MKSTIIKLSLLITSLVLVGACLPDDEKQNQGTVLGVTACISKNSQQSELVSETLIKQQCINKHEQILNYNDQRNIKRQYDRQNAASVDVEGDQLIVYASTLWNNFDDIVITSIELSGCYRDGNGKKNCKSKWVHDLWVEPNNSFSGNVRVPYDYTGPKIETWCSKLEVKKNCKGWQIPRYKGLRIKLQ